jgi:hypothetical protein
MNWYCSVAARNSWHGPDHDTEYVFPISDETVLLERLALEITRAGLQPLTVPKTIEAFNWGLAGLNLEAGLRLYVRRTCAATGQALIAARNPPWIQVGGGFRDE